MRSPRPATWLSALFDFCCVLVFVIIGRASHAKGEELAGIVSTTWPFLSGLVIGWACSVLAGARPIAQPRSDRAGRPDGSRLRLEKLWPAGISTWLCTVAFGMVLRVVSGQGTAVSFIIVALCFLGLFILGWRVVAGLLARVPRQARVR